MHNESHGSHVCHKCGWSYPNSHPSAKHRRAHKKVCGKLEGFKIPESEERNPFDGSDDGHLSDEDPKVEENQNGGIRRQISNRSEEEEFSDAVSEFADTKIVATVVDAIVVDSDSKDSAISNIIQPSNNPSEGIQIQIPHTSQNITDQLDIDETFQHHSSGTTMGSNAGPVLDKSAELLAVEPTKETNESTNLATPVNYGGSENANLENILTGNSVMETMAFIEEKVDTKGKSDLDGSLSPVASPSKTIREASQTDIEIQTMDRFTGEAFSSDVTDAITTDTEPLDGSFSAIAASPSKAIDGFTGGGISLDVTDVNTVIVENTKPLDVVVDLKEEETHSFGQNVSSNEFFHDSCTNSMEVEATKHMGASVGFSQPEVDCAHEVDIDCPDDNVGDCVAKEVNTNLPALSERTVKDCKYPELVKSELSVTPDYGEAIRETEVKNSVSEEIPLGFLSSKSGDGDNISSLAARVHEENPQILGREVIVEQVSVDCVADSEANDTTIGGLESHELEILPDSTSTDVKYIEKNQMVCSIEGKESHSQQDLPQTPIVVAVAGGTVLSPSDAVVHEAINAVSSQDDIAHENSRIDNPDNCIREGTTEENSITNKMVAPEAAILLSESENLKDAEAIPLDINETVTEPLSDPQVFEGEDFRESSKELEFSKSIDTSSVSKSEVQIESVGADSMVTEAVLEETKLSQSSVVGLFESGAENPVESMSSVVDTASCVVSSGSVEENNIKSSVEGYISDIHSKSLKEEGDDDLLKQQPDASEVVPPDGSVDSISQTDSMEGYWGSVSDGRVSSLRDATDVLPTSAQTSKEEAQVAELKKTRGATEDRLTANNDIFEAPSFMTLVEPGRGNYQHSTTSEIQPIQNPQQSQSSYSQAAWFPSLNHVTTETQGRKKNEKIIAKVANWSSGKSHTPLKTLLVEANLESKQKATSAQHSPKPPAHKDDVTLPTDSDLPANKTGPEVSTSHASTMHMEKEWNSPARLPQSKEKRKQKYWVPFVCCSSVN